MAKKNKQRQKMLDAMPEDLSKKQQRQFKKAYRQEGPKAANKYLKRQEKKGKYAPAGDAPPEGMPGEQTPEQMYPMDSGSQAVATGLDVAGQQADIQSRYNRPDQFGAYGGGLEWTQDPNTGEWTRRETLGGPQQRMLDLEQQYSVGGRQAGLAAGEEAFRRMGQPYGFGGISDVYGGGDMAGARDQAASASFDAAMSRMQPRLDQEKAEFEEMAQQKGWVPGSKIYEQEKNRMAQSQQDRVSQIENESYNRGLQEMQTMYGLSTQERGRQIGEMERLRDRPFQESQMMMQAGPGIRQDQFQDYGPMSVQQVDPMQAYGIDTQRYLQEQNLSWDERKQRVQQRWENKQRKKTQAWQSSENAADRALQAQLAAQAAAMAGPHGPMGPTPEQQMQMARDQMIWEREQGFRGPAGGGGGGGSDPWSAIAGGVAHGIGQGLGRGWA